MPRWAFVFPLDVLAFSGRTSSTPAFAGHGERVTHSKPRRTGRALLAFAAWLVGAFAYSQAASAPRAHKADYQDSSAQEARLYGDTFAWQEEGPLEFLALLRQRAKEGSWVYTVHGIHVGWLRDSDLKLLMEAVESEEPCAHVVMTVSSYLPPGPSSVGEEALFLLHGYRKGRYPPELHSDRHPKKEEMLEWWRLRVLALRQQDRE